MSPPVVGLVVVTNAANPRNGSIEAHLLKAYGLVSCFDPIKLGIGIGDRSGELGVVANFALFLHTPTLW